MSILKVLTLEEESLQAQLDAQQKKVEDLKAMLDGIKALKAKYRKGEVLKGEKPQGVTKVGNYTYPTQYSADLKLYQRIYIALMQIKSGDVDEVARALKKLDPKEYRDSKYTKKAAANGLFQLYNKQQKITAIQGKAGRYTYSIK